MSAPRLPPLIQELLRPSAYPHPTGRVRLVQTHISYVLLAGEHVYKVKKPVSFGFLDFSTPGKRRYGSKSGIYHYRARFYSADIGRFLSPDSIVPGAGDPQALNRYAYVANNPLRYTDPSGHALMDQEYGSDPLAAAATVVGSTNPQSNNPDHYCFWATGKCQGRYERWVERTRRAAAIIRYLGPARGIDDVNDVPWSPDQRVSLGYDYSHTGVRFQADYDDESLTATKSNWETLATIAAGGVVAGGAYTAAAASRAAELQEMLPADSRGRVTMGYGFARDQQGNLVRLVGTSEPGGYLRPGVALAEGEIVAAGPRGSHAEVDIVNYAQARGWDVIAVSSGRPSCPMCTRVIFEAVKK